MASWLTTLEELEKRTPVDVATAFPDGLMVGSVLPPHDGMKFSVQNLLSETPQTDGLCFAPPITVDIVGNAREKLLNSKAIFSTQDLLELQQIPQSYDTLCESLMKIHSSRDPTTRIDYSLTSSSRVVEMELPNQQSSANSSSMNRAPTSREFFQRGSVQSRPFKPGGIDKVDLDKVRELTTENAQQQQQNNSHQPTLAKNSLGLFHIAPGFPRGLPEPNETEKITATKNCAQVYLTVMEQEQEKETAKTAEASRTIGLGSGLLSDVSLENLFGGTGNSVNPSGQIEVEDSTSSRGVIEDSTQKRSRVEPEDNVDPISGERRPSFGEIMTKLNDFQAWNTTQGKADASNEWAIEDKCDISQFHSQVPNLAHSYPFELDDFQKRGILRLEQGQFVFVAAHTSAGKTVVAEYAIALAMKHMTRAVYTSPIKTLSNQKFREFKKTFGDVGLMTGDLTIQPEASCLIMTTEILRSMLYRGADLIRDIEWVIFDEVHYINDVERGVVWEETIIMLPEHVNIVLLSASVPNTHEFADWIGRTKQRKVYVVKTSFRPVPLEHALYTCRKIFPIMDEGGDFKHASYHAAQTALKDSQQKPLKPGQVLTQQQQQRQQHQQQQRRGRPSPKTVRMQWSTLISDLDKASNLPVVCFTFSKKRCEETVDFLQNLTLTTSVERSEIHVFLNTCVTKLSVLDRSLPQILRMREMLGRGMGVHHAGLLPIMKEVVEILFSRGLVKVLFATETFAMGVNMPARTVIFNGIRKHDGQQFRPLTPSEYQQMSGRAGRRGLDKRGLVLIVAWDEIPAENILQGMLRGKPTKLESQFRLTYNMIVNLLRVEDFRVEDILKRSFSEVNSQKSLPSKTEILSLGQEYMKNMAPLDCLFGEPAIDDYHDLFQTAEKFFVESRVHLSVSAPFANFVERGQLLLVQTSSFGHCLAIVLDSPRPLGDATTRKVICFAVSTAACPETLPLGSIYGQKHLLASTIIAEHPLAKACAPERILVRGTTLGVEWEVLELGVTSIRGFCKDKFKTEMKKHRLSHSEQPNSATMAVVTKIANIMRANPMGPNLLSETQDLKVNTIDFVEAHDNWKKLQELMKESKCLQCPKLDEQFGTVARRSHFKEKLDQLSFAMSDKSLNLLPDFLNRSMVLEKLGYIGTDRTLKLKGRVACEIHTVDELLTTELIFDNAFTDLECEEIAALLCTMLCKEKSDDDPKLTDHLREAFDRMKMMAKKVGELQAECGIDIDPDDAVRSLNPALMEVVFEWVRGLPFSEIVLCTLIPEGSIVRTITRLDVTCGEIKNAARAIGNATLFQKMEAVSQKIKRDIVFAASLYVQ